MLNGGGTRPVLRARVRWVPDLGFRFYPHFWIQRLRVLRQEGAPSTIVLRDIFF